MGWQRFVASLVGSLAWPLVVVILVGALLRTQRAAISALIPRIKRAKALGGEIEFADTDKADEEVNEALAVAADAALELRFAIEASGQVRHADGTTDADEPTRIAPPPRDQTEAARQLELQQFARAVARAAQVQAVSMPTAAGALWEPILGWRPDGSGYLRYWAAAPAGDLVILADQGHGEDEIRVDKGDG